MVSRITIEVIGPIWGRYRGVVYVDGLEQVGKFFDTYAEAMTWAVNEQSSREREVKDR